MGGFTYSLCEIILSQDIQKMLMVIFVWRLCFDAICFLVYSWKIYIPRDYSKTFWMLPPQLRDYIINAIKIIRYLRSIVAADDQPRVYFNYNRLMIACITLKFICFIYILFTPTRTPPPRQFLSLRKIVINGDSIIDCESIV